MKKYGFTTLDFGGTGNRFLDGKLDSVGCTDFGVGEHRKVMVESFRAIHEQTISLRNLQMNSSRWTETRK